MTGSACCGSEDGGLLAQRNLSGFEASVPHSGDAGEPPAAVGQGGPAAPGSATWGAGGGGCLGSPYPRPLSFKLISELKESNILAPVWSINDLRAASD